MKSYKAFFQVRHGGDPLIAAVNLSKSKNNHLKFDDDNNDIKQVGIITLSISTCLLLCTMAIIL